MQDVNIVYQNRLRVEMCIKLLKIYKNCNGRRLSEIYTGNETRIDYSEPQRKIGKKKCG